MMGSDACGVRQPPKPSSTSASTAMASMVAADSAVASVVLRPRLELRGERRRVRYAGAARRQHRARAVDVGEVHELRVGLTALRPDRAAVDAGQRGGVDRDAPEPPRACIHAEAS